MSNNKDFMKKLGLQSMLISPDFANFTRWVCELTEENYLSEAEIVKVNELNAASTFVDDADSINERINEIVGNTFTDIGIDELQDEYDDLKDAEEVWENLLSTGNATESRMDAELNQLNSEIQDSQTNVESLTQKCQMDAQFLEDQSIRNIENRKNFLTSFSSQLSSPMRWSRLDYENYFVDCDSASLSMKLLFDKTLKLTENTSFVEEDDEHKKRLYDLYTLETTFTRTGSALHEMKLDLCRIDSLIDMLSKPLQSMTCGLMSEQIERLTWQNEDFEENLENLESTIQEKIAQLGHQEAKFCEVENNREKMIAAEKRLDLLKKCEASASDHLLLSEFMWLSMNMEKEAMESIFESVASAHYEEENEKCGRNLEILANVPSDAVVDHVQEDFANQVAEIVADDDIVADGDHNPIARYAERMNQFADQLKDVVSDSYQIKIAGSIKYFNGISIQLNPFIGNGPSIRPNIWNLPVLAESQIFKGKFDLMFDLSRMMRHNFMEKYHQPYLNDELWKRRQLLWIWFLTDQETFLEAFQKTLAVSAKSSNHGNLSISGLKRKN